MLVEKKVVLINEKRYVLEIYVEKRNSFRVSITKNGANIRVPKRLSLTNQRVEIQKMIDWAIKRIQRNPDLGKTAKKYEHLNTLNIFDKNYVIHIINRDSTKNFSRINNEIIEFRIANKHTEEIKQKYISKQLQKLLAQSHLQDLFNLTYDLNKTYFQKEVKDVSFKYTKSRWGCCSVGKKEINISTKLLLAPIEVLKYVIIHELAHLIEANHSRRFWNLVREVDPKYKTKIKWLKLNGHKLVI